MQLVVHKSFQIHGFVKGRFGFILTVQQNRMIQITLCEPAFSCESFDLCWVSLEKYPGFIKVDTNDKTEDL